MGKIETVYDHNITNAELKALFGYASYTREFFEKQTQENNYIDIFRLYLIRKDKINCKKYFGLIPESEHKTFTLANHDFAIW